MGGGEWEPGGEWGREGYGRQELESSNRVGSGRNRIDLVTVFDTILTSRQTREKLQCLYENLMSDNFHRKAVLKKYEYERF